MATTIATTMVSEPPLERLHPSSLLFLIGAQLRALVIPALVYVFVGEGSALRFLILIFILPTAIQPLFHYVSFRYQLRPNHIVVREGLMFRNERRIPYTRIHTVDMAQNPLHRLAGVAVVRLETASGGKPEAIMRVLSLDALERLRSTVGASAERPEPTATRDLATELEDSCHNRQTDRREKVLLQLSFSDLVRLGLVSNQGLVVIVGAIALFFQQGLFDWERIDFDQLTWLSGAPNLARQVEAAANGGNWIAGLVLTIGVGVFGLAALYLLSILLAILRFYGFRLTRRGDFLRVEMGLFTRVAQTTPRRRIQHLRTFQGPIHRLLRRSSIRMDTAGGNDGDASSGSFQPQDSGGASRQWLAPLVEPSDVAPLVHQAQPEIDLALCNWRPIAQRAWTRRLRVGMVFFVGIGGVVSLVTLWGLLIPLAALPLQLFLAQRYVRCRHYCTTDHALLWRSGWWRKRLSIVLFSKIQAVVLDQSPFDRRQRMASVRIDTAGASRAGHAIDIRYLEISAARELARTLHQQASGRAYFWS